MTEQTSYYVSGKHGLVGVPVRPELLNIFPDAKQVTMGGNDLVLIRHGADETRLLRNLGMEVPAPILSQYDWMSGTPFDVQKRTCALLTMNRRAYVLNGMGTGKTKAALWSWHFLRLRGEAKKLLVVAPLSTLNFTWGREVMDTIPGTNVQVLHGTKKRRLAKLADTEADIYIINHDGLKIIAPDLEARDDIDTLILDELAVYRNGQSARTKVTSKVTQRMKWAWGLTGSPTPNAPTDAWAQCKLLTPDTVPKYFNRFRDDVMTKVSNFRFVPKPTATETVFEAMQPAVRYTLDDVVELPELVERTIDVEIGAKQHKVYKAMVEHAHALIDGNEITAMNAGVVLNKLLQISIGYVYNRQKETVALDNAARLTAIADIVDATDRKVIVFAPFVHALEGISDRLINEGYDTRIISGATSKGDREDAFNLFQNTDKVKVLVAHPQTMSHGLTLTAADTIVWAAPITSLETFLQANARIRRVGQKHKQQVIMLQATAVEKKCYSKLRSKQQVMNLLLEMYEEQSI